MADGKEDVVPHPDYISVPPKGAFVVVFDDQELAFVRPLLTMTGLADDTNSTPRRDGCPTGKTG